MTAPVKPLMGMTVKLNDVGVPPAETVDVVGVTATAKSGTGGAAVTLRVAVAVCVSKPAVAVNLSGYAPGAVARDGVSWMEAAVAKDASATLHAGAQVNPAGAATEIVTGALKPAVGAMVSRNGAAAVPAWVVSERGLTVTAKSPGGV